MKIELIPGLMNPNLKLKLEERFINCLSFKGCVAFWTIKVDFFSTKAFVQALKKEGSFFCCDIQLPTSIDNISEYHKAGVREIYLHKYRQSPDEHTQNTNLLHSKILLFQLDEVNIEIWVGSHNFTRYAIEGMNLEASILIQCTIEDEIYKSISKYLEYVKGNFCFQFDETKKDIYKILQTRDAQKTTSDDEPQKVVTLVGDNMDTLVQEQVILLLSLNEKSYTQFRTTGVSLRLHTYDISQKKEFIYICTIEQTGRFDETIDKLELDFTKPRRFAYIGTGKLPFLKKQTKVTNEILEKSKYFVNISITDRIDDFEILEKPTNEDSSFWRTEEENPYFQRLTLENSQNDSGGSQLLFDEDTSYDGKKNKFTIQIATLDTQIKYKLVDLAKDWQLYHRSLELFYAELDKLILQKFDDRQLIGGQDINVLLENFLEEAKKDKNLSQYSKSLVERIIRYPPSQKKSI